MAEKQKLELLGEHSKKLETLRQQRQSLNVDLYKELDKAEMMFSKLDTMKRDQVEGELSKLDKSLEQYGGYKQTIADLASGLTENLTEYVQFAAEGQNYQGIEKVLAFLPFTHKMADRKRVERLRMQ